MGWAKQKRKEINGAKTLEKGTNYTNLAHSITICLKHHCTSQVACR
jgi:hypothetical protein